jgi:hypothetical protein
MIEVVCIFVVAMIIGYLFLRIIDAIVGND